MQIFIHMSGHLSRTMTCMLQSYPSLHFFLSYVFSLYKSPQISQISWLLISFMPMSFPFVSLQGLISTAVSWTLPSLEMEPPQIGLEGLNSIVFFPITSFFFQTPYQHAPHSSSLVLLGAFSFLTSNFFF